jgi:hypothetical protein
MDEKGAEEAEERVERYLDALEWGIENADAMNDDVLKAFVAMMRKRIEKAEEKAEGQKVVS